MPIQDLELVNLIRVVISNLNQKEPLDLPDNTVCHIDDISIPHTWRTIESHNNGFYTIFKYEYLVGGGYETTVAYNCNPYVLTLPGGTYTGPQVATATQELLNGIAVNFDFEVFLQTCKRKYHH